MDYCTAGPQFASGGFIADSRLPFVINGSQQQWLTRNSEVGGWSNGVWNQVFSGVVGAPAEAAFPDPPYTTLETTPLSREKPWLYVDAPAPTRCGCPTRHRHARHPGPTATTAGRTLPLVRLLRRHARATRSQAINAQLARGKNLLLTPGRLRRRPSRSRSSGPAPSCSAWATRR